MIPKLENYADLRRERDALREENVRLRADVGALQAGYTMRGEEVARLEGLILDWSNAVPLATSPRMAGQRVAQADAALEAEARRIRAAKGE